MPNPTILRAGLLALLCGTLLGAGAATPAATQDPAPPLATIAALDLPRYMGTWYEIAKYPNRFQKDCASNTRAQYSLQPGGGVQVINRCRRADGSLDEAIGSARQPGDDTSPRLQVRFAPRWLSFLPFVWGNYWVVDLDPDYQLAAVSEPTREYLWILSRTPTVPPAAYAALLERLAYQGFDLSRLTTTPQGQ
ncbi:MAG TPA: lipocalin [Massilia sp.]|nr:lipocalin [Massilia sp.]